MIHHKQITYAGKSIREATKAMILLHGRGGSSADILSLSNYLNVEGFALLAPQANDNTWYPYSFMAPVQRNEPWLSDALNLVKATVDEVKQAGIAQENIYLLGFSQGACLALEFACRNAGKYGGIIAFTGGVIGEKIYKENYKGDFQGTPVFVGSSNVDLHVPLQRVHDSAEILKSLGAVVTAKIYEGMGHTINEDELEIANSVVTNGASFSNS